MPVLYSVVMIYYGIVAPLVAVCPLLRIPGSIEPAKNKKPGERVPGLYLLAFLDASTTIAIGKAMNHIKMNLTAFHINSRINLNTSIVTTSNIK